MSQLKALFEKLGFNDVETFIASGNVLFSSELTKASALESKIAGHLETALGYDVGTFVRSAKEVMAIGSVKSFLEDGQAGITIHVGLLQQKLSPEIAKNFSAVRTATDEFHVTGREFYWLCRIPSHESKVWTLPEIKALKLPATTLRNLTSIRKLIAKHFE